LPLAVTGARILEWFPVTLLCAFSLASADAATKRWLADYRAGELVLVRFVVAGVMLLPLVWWFPLPPVPPAFWGWFGLLLPLELTAMWLYMTAIRDTPLHLTLPYLAFTPAFNVVTGWLLLGETVSLRGLAGILLVVVGAYLLNTGDSRDGLLAPFRAVLRVRGSWIMLLVALIYSVTSVAGKAAMAYATPASFGAFYYVAVGAATLVVFGLRRPGQLRALTRRPAPTLLVGGLMAVMVVTHFLAIALTEVAYMVAVKRTSLLFGILYGAWVFGERGLTRQLTAGGLMVAGVAAIAL